MNMVVDRISPRQYKLAFIVIGVLAAIATVLSVMGLTPPAVGVALFVLFVIVLAMAYAAEYRRRSSSRGRGQQ